MASRTSDWRDELGRWLKPFLDRLGHKARRQMCPLYGEARRLCCQVTVIRRARPELLSECSSRSRDGTLTLGSFFELDLLKK
jgi:hypothetical protein